METFRNESIIVNAVIEAVAKTGLVTDGIIDAANKLGTTFSDCRKIWMRIRTRYSYAIEVIRKQRVIMEKKLQKRKLGKWWTTKEKIILLTLVHEMLSKGRTLKEAYELASQQIGRTISACRKQYYSLTKSFKREIASQAITNIRKVIKEIQLPLKQYKVRSLAKERIQRILLSVERSVDNVIQISQPKTKVF